MAENQNLLRDAVTRIPIWTGDNKDVFTPEQWLARIEKARVAAAWNEADTLSFIYCSLRGEALLWYDVLKRSGIADTYDAFRTAFLTSYAPALTARTATVCLHDIKQTAQESIVAFYSRVIKAVNDLENLLPAAQRVPAGAAYPAEVVALAGYAGLAANVRNNGIAALINSGITTAMNHIGLQLFVAGLRSSIRDELMKNMPDSLWAAFQAAMAMEKITSTPKASAFAAVNQVSAEQPESEGEIELEIDAVRAQLKRLEYRKNSGRPNTSGRTGGGTGTGKYDPKAVICRCCKKKGHMQEVCYTRINKNLPCVDAQGKPWRTQPAKPQGRVNEVAEQNSSPVAAVAQPPPNFAPPQSNGGYWTPYPPNFQ